MPKKIHLITAVVFSLFIQHCTVSSLLQEDEYLFQEGLYSYEMENFSKALSLFTDLALNYNNEDSWFYKGLTEMRLAEDSVTEVLISELYFKEAILSFGSVTGKNENYVDALFYKGYCYYSVNEFDSSILIFENLESAYSKHSKADNAIFYSGNAFYKKGDTLSAITAYEKILDDYKESSSYDNALFKLGSYYFRNRHVEDNDEKALDYLEEYCLLVSSDRPNYYLAQNMIEVLNDE